MRTLAPTIPALMSEDMVEGGKTPQLEVAFLQALDLLIITDVSPPSLRASGEVAGG
jgi:hypothetical protein